MTVPLWTAGALREATGGRLVEEVAVTGVSIDSRSVVAGDLFVALRAERDGHDFVPDAFARGAACAMVDRDLPGGTLLRVADTLGALTALGAAGRARSGARCIGITGSVGKTTTKEMLRVALGAFGATHAAVASYNNHWGVPLTLARMPADTTFGVIEIGMNNRGEIAPLTRLARPHVALITSIAPAHIGHLGSLEAIAAEKGDIMLGLEPGGVLVAPADSPFYPELAARAAAQGAAITGFGEGPGAACRLLSYAGDADGGRAEILCRGERIVVMLSAPGRHVAQNATAALAVIAALGLPVRQAAALLPAFGAGAGRGRRLAIAVPGGEALLIDDSYNGQPPAMRAGLAVLGAQPATRRIAVLGEMRELGEAGPALHAGLVPDVVANCDLLFCCGGLMSHLYEGIPQPKRGAFTPDSAALVPLLRAALKPGDAVLVKGSLGSRMAVVIEALTRRETGSAAA